MQKKKREKCNSSFLEKLNYQSDEKLAGQIFVGKSLARDL